MAVRKGEKTTTLETTTLGIRRGRSKLMNGSEVRAEEENNK